MKKTKQKVSSDTQDLIVSFLMTKNIDPTISKEGRHRIGMTSPEYVQASKALSVLSGHKSSASIGMIMDNILNYIRFLVTGITTSPGKVSKTTITRRGWEYYSALQIIERKHL